MEDKSGGGGWAVVYIIAGIIGLVAFMEFFMWILEMLGYPIPDLLILVQL